MAGPQVDLIAHQSGAVLQAPTDNSALQLADALSGVNTALKPALQDFAADQKEKQGAKAHADAMANSGTAFADAVRSGKIQPTQNPWYIQAYESNAATVRGQQEVSALYQDSQTWASRNDAPAFQKEFQTKLGEIAQKYQGPDQAKGFEAAAAPLAQQAIQQNVQYNVARIKEENVQNIGTLATASVLKAKTLAPPPIPEALAKAPQPTIPGNLDPWNRPILKNADGGYSTTSSISIGTDKGEVLIPTVVDGKRLTEAEARAHYQKTGENFGTFPEGQYEAADQYATALHNAQDAYVQANGGPDHFAPQGATPDAHAVFAALEPHHQQWIATGGTEADWNQIAINAVVAAGFNSGDASILSVLDDPRGGKGALSNIAGPDGQPVAQALATARYRIEQEASSQGMSALRARQNAVKLEGMKAADLVTQHYGYDFLQGKVAKADIITYLQAQGVSAQGAQSALGELSKAAADNASLGRSLMGADPEVLSLSLQASRQGFTQHLSDRLAEKVRLGEMNNDEAQQVLGTANARTNHLESEARSDTRSAKSDARALAADQRRLTVDQAKALKAHRDQRVNVIATALASAGIKTLADPKARAAFGTRLSDAEGNYLAFHSGDTMGASLAVDSESNAYANEVIARRRKRAAASGSTTGNSRR